MINCDILFGWLIYATNLVGLLGSGVRDVILGIGKVHTLLKH